MENKQAPVRKRIIACGNCRLTHKKCSEERPCRTCVSLGIPELCCDPPQKKTTQYHNYFVHPSSDEPIKTTQIVRSISTSTISTSSTSDSYNYTSSRQSHQHSRTSSETALPSVKGSPPTSNLERNPTQNNHQSVPSVSSILPDTLSNKPSVPPLYQYNSSTRMSNPEYHSTTPQAIQSPQPTNQSQPLPRDHSPNNRFIYDMTNEERAHNLSPIMHLPREHPRKQHIETMLPSHRL